MTLCNVYMSFKKVPPQPLYLHPVGTHNYTTMKYVYLVIRQRSIQSESQCQSIQTPNIWWTVRMTNGW